MGEGKLTTMRGGEGCTSLAANALSSSGSKREGGGRSVSGSGMPAMAPSPNPANYNTNNKELTHKLGATMSFTIRSTRSSRGQLRQTSHKTPLRSCCATWTGLQCTDRRTRILVDSVVVSVRQLALLRPLPL